MAVRNRYVLAGPSHAKNAGRGLPADKLGLPAGANSGNA